LVFCAISFYQHKFVLAFGLSFLFTAFSVPGNNSNNNNRCHHHLAYVVPLCSEDFRGTGRYHCFTVCRLCILEWVSLLCSVDSHIHVNRHGCSHRCQCAVILSARLRCTRDDQETVHSSDWM